MIPGPAGCRVYKAMDWKGRSCAENSIGLPEEEATQVRAWPLQLRVLVVLSRTFGVCGVTIWGPCMLAPSGNTAGTPIRSFLRTTQDSAAVTKRTSTRSSGSSHPLMPHLTQPNIQQRGWPLPTITNHSRSPKIRRTSVSGG